ncbi:MAG: CsbD family protein [Chloroflexota bacterium]
MNSDILKGNWKQFRGEVQKQWGKLTNDDMDVINGEYDKLVGRVQERYGWNRERAEREVTDYFDRQTTPD